jgi:hypothetical protein
MAGIAPATGTAPDGIEAQTERALRNLAAVLASAGAFMADLVKPTIFYSDVEDFGRLNQVCTRHMPDPPPARLAPAKCAPATRPADLDRGHRGAAAGGVRLLGPTCELSSGWEQCGRVRTGFSRVYCCRRVARFHVRRSGPNLDDRQCVAIGAHSRTPYQ